jgi:hypothetical protein
MVVVVRALAALVSCVHTSNLGNLKECVEEMRSFLPTVVVRHGTIVVRHGTMSASGLGGAVRLERNKLRGVRSLFTVEC